MKMMEKYFNLVFLFGVFLRAQSETGKYSASVE